MSDKVAQLLAKLTAGNELKPIGGRGGTVASVNTVMAALGMGRAGRPGSLILVANYMDDERAKRWAEQWLTRWAWLTWLKVGISGANVTADQMRRLAALALSQHIAPEAARRTSLKAQAKKIGVNHQTFVRKYRKHLARIRAEISYQESQAIEALLKHLG